MNQQDAAHTNKTSASYLLLALLLSLLAALPLLIGQGIVNTRAGGDSPFLVQRVHQLSQNLRAGIFPVRWMPEAAHGLGYPFFNFYASFPYYIASLLNMAGCGMLWGIKLTQALGFVVAGLASFFLARKVLGNQMGALLASAVYTFAPFHLANVYVRGDSLSEFYAFALYPLIIWAILKLRERPSPERIALLAVSYALLVLTHNISWMIFTPLVGIWLIAESLLPAKRANWRVLAAGCAGIGLGLLVTAWFWLPLLRERSLVQLQEQTTGYFHYMGHFRTIDLLQWQPIHDYAITGRRDPFSTGLIQALVAIVGLVALAITARRKRTVSVSQGLAVLSLAIYTWLITPSSQWIWEQIPLLHYVQFPWRLLSVQALAIGLIAANIPILWSGRGGKGVGLILVGIAAVAGMAGLRPDRLPLQEDDITPQRLMLYETFSGNLGTTIRHEYLPQEMIPSPLVSAVQWNNGEKPPPLVLEGELGAAQLVERSPTSETWELEVSTPSLLAFHTTFYAGWQARVDGQSSAVEPLEGLGLIGLRLPPGTHRVTLTFKETILRQWADGISLIGLLGVLALTLYPCLHSRRYRTGVLVAAGVMVLGGGWLLIAPDSTPTGRTVQGPIVMDYARAPYLHEEPEGIYLGEALLRSYSLDATQAKPGEALRLLLTWQQAYPESEVRVQLVGTTAHLFEPSPIWAEDSATINELQTELTLNLPEEISPGIYVPRLTVQKRGEEQPVRTFQGSGMGAPSLEPVQIVAGQMASGQEPGIASYGPERVPPIITLVRMETTEHGEGLLETELVWRCESQAPLNYMLSLRLRNADGQQITARDLPPLLGGYPTSLWRPGELITDRVILTLPEDVPRPGEYQLEAVLYDRLNLRDAGAVAIEEIVLR